LAFICLRVFDLAPTRFELVFDLTRRFDEVLDLARFFLFHDFPYSFRLGLNPVAGKQSGWIS
jgi:hypothetical protein